MPHSFVTATVRNRTPTKVGQAILLLLRSSYSSSLAFNKGSVVALSGSIFKFPGCDTPLVKVCLCSPPVARCGASVNILVAGHVITRIRREAGVGTSSTGSRCCGRGHSFPSTGRGESDFQERSPAPHVASSVSVYRIFLYIYAHFRLVLLSRLLKSGCGAPAHTGHLRTGLKPKFD